MSYTETIEKYGGAIDVEKQYLLKEGKRIYNLLCELAKISEQAKDIGLMLLGSEQYAYLSIYQQHLEQNQ